MRLACVFLFLCAVSGILATEQPGSGTSGDRSSGSGSGDSGDRPSGSGSGDSGDRPSGSGSGDSGDRPSGSGSGDSGDRPSGSGSGDSGDRPSGSGSGDSGDRPSGSGSGDSGDRPSGSGSGDSGDRPSGSGSGDSGDRPSGSGSGDSGDRPSGSGSGDSGDRPSGSGSGDSGDRPSGSGSGDSGDRPSGSGSGDSGDRPSGSGSGDSGDRPSGSGSGDSGDIPSGSGSGDSGDRPSGSGSGDSGDRPSGSGSGDSGDRPSGSGSGDSGDRPSGSGSGSSGSGLDGTTPRPRPGIGADGGVVVDEIYPAVALDRLAEDADTFSGQEVALCARMFQVCASATQLAGFVRYGIDCHQSDDWRGTSRMIRNTTCPSAWQQQNERAMCTTTLGTEDRSFTECLGCAVTSSDFPDPEALTADQRAQLLTQRSGEGCSTAATQDTREVINEVYGEDSSQWNEDTVREILDNDQAESLTASQLRDIDESALTTNERLGLHTGDRVEQQRIATESIDDPATASCADMEAALPYMTSDVSVMNEIPADTLTDCFQQILASDSDAFTGDSEDVCAQMAPMLQRMRESENFDASTLNENEQLRACMTQEERSAVLGSLSDADVEAWASPEAAESLDTSSRREVARRLDLEAGAVTREELENVAGVADQLGQDFYAEVDDGVLLEALDTLADALNRDRGLAQRVRERLESEGEDPAVFVENCVTGGLNPGDLAESAASDMGVDGETPFTCSLSMGLAATVLDRYIAENDDIRPNTDSDGDVWGEAAVTSLGCLLAEAASEDLLNNFDDSRIPSIAETACSCDLNAIQRRAMEDRVTAMTAEVSGDEAVQMSCFMSRRDISEIPEADRCSTAQTVYTEMGTQSVTLRTYADLEADTTRAVENVCVNDELVNVRETDSISLEHVQHLGNLCCGLQLDDVTRAEDADTVRELASAMTSCLEIVPLDVRQALADRANALITDMTESDAVALAGFMDLMDTSGLSEAVRESASAPMLEVLGTITDNINARLSHNLPTTTDTDGLAEVTLDTLAAYTNAGARRRKRSSDISCSDVTVAGSASVYFTATQLATISDFTDCASTLGEIEGWSSTQLDELVTLAKVEYGSDVATWSSDNMMTAGTIIAGLSVTEMGSLVLDSNDVMSVLGQYDIYSTAQLEAGFENYLERMYGSSETGSSLTGTDLASLGEFVCGASTTEIANIPDASYQSAATSVGEARSCDEARMTAYADKAMDADVFGDVTSWSAVDVATIGNVIGGITAADMRGLTETQIDVISSTAIALVPANTLAALSTTQISYLSTVQAEAVTAEQQEEMTNAQLVALEAAGGTIEVDTDVDSDSGAAHVLGQLCTVLAATYAVLLANRNI